MINLQERFEYFKRVTGEENKIIEIIKNNLPIEKYTSILEVGSNKGNISRALQPNQNNITLLDVENFQMPDEIKYIKERWEKAIIKEKFEVIIASHVWGHFYHNKSTKKSFDKMINCLKSRGRLVLCYNINEGFLNKIIKFTQKEVKDFQYDIFDESIINKENKKIEFEIEVKSPSFKNLAEMIHVLMVMSEDSFNDYRAKIELFLEENLKKPRFIIKQRVMIIEKI